MPFYEVGQKAAVNDGKTRNGPDSVAPSEHVVIIGKLLETPRCPKGYNKKDHGDDKTLQGHLTGIEAIIQKKRNVCDAMDSNAHST